MWVIGTASQRGWAFRTCRSSRLGTTGPPDSVENAAQVFPEVGANMLLPPAAPCQCLRYFRQLRVLVTVHQIARRNILSEHAIEAIDALPAAPMTALERQLPVIGAGREVGAEGNVLEAGNVDDVLEVANVVVDSGFPRRILVPAHRAIDAGADHPARLRHRLDDFVGLVALQIGEGARIGVRHQHRLRGNLDHAAHRTLADVGEINGNAGLIHDFYGVAAKQREACLFGFKATVAERVAVIIRELHDPKPEPPQEIETIELVGDRPHVLQAHDDANLALGLGMLEISRGLDLQPRRAGPIDDAVPARDLRTGLREVGLEMASRDVEGIDATGL